MYLYVSCQKQPSSSEQRARGGEATAWPWRMPAPAASPTHSGVSVHLRGRLRTAASSPPSSEAGPGTSWCRPPGSGRWQPGLKSTPPTRLVAARYGRSDGGCPQINISIAPAPSHPSACLGSYLMHQNNSSSLIYCGRLQILTWVLWPGLAPARASIKHNTAPHHPNLSSELLQTLRSKETSCLISCACAMV